MNYDEQEPTEEELNDHQLRQAGKKPSVTISGITAESIESLILGAVEERFDMHSRIDDAIRRAFAEQVKQAIDAFASEVIKLEVQKILDAGWVETDQWGHEKKRWTLSERISAHLEEKSNGYSGSGTRYQEWVKSGVEECFKQSINGELARVKVDIKTKVAELTDKKLQEMVGAMVDGRLAEMIKGAIGIKV